MLKQSESSEPNIREQNSFGLVHCYKGLQIKAVHYLHGYVNELVKETFRPGAKVMDLAAGTGALSLRLKEMGFRVTACDLNPENFQLHSTVNFHCIDLNEEFGSQFSECFDGLVAIEIIEHLENPRRFLRECFKMLSVNGMIVLSTPNIDNPVSKAIYIRTSKFQWFSDHDYRESGHITPICRWYLEKALEEAGFANIKFATIGDPFAGLTRWWKMRMLAQLIRPLMDQGRKMQGEILVAVAAKP